MTFWVDLSSFRASTLGCLLKLFRVPYEICQHQRLWSSRLSTNSKFFSYFVRPPPPRHDLKTSMVRRPSLNDLVVKLGGWGSLLSSAIIPMIKIMELPLIQDPPPPSINPRVFLAFCIDGSAGTCGTRSATKVSQCLTLILHPVTPPSLSIFGQMPKRTLTKSITISFSCIL